MHLPAARRRPKNDGGFFGGITFLLLLLSHPLSCKQEPFIISSSQIVSICDRLTLLLNFLVSFHGEVMHASQSRGRHSASVMPPTKMSCTTRRDKTNIGRC